MPKSQTAKRRLLADAAGLTAKAWHREETPAIAASRAHVAKSHFRMTSMGI
jgi:hypothetical protein